MPRPTRPTPSAAALALALAWASAGSCSAGGEGAEGPPPDGEAAPAAVASPAAEGLPGPYRTERNWGTLPEGRSWGSVSALEVDVDGRHLWVAERCGANSCVGSDLDPVLLLDPEGRVVRSFGRGLFAWPHGLHVDAGGNVWVTDAGGGGAGEAGRGHAVHKFSPAGELLLTLGTPGVRGDGTGPLLTEPNDVVTLPNGDVLVAEAHTGQGQARAAAGTVARVARFSGGGAYLGSFGRFGTGPGELRTPHALALDAAGRLFVADRGNNRVQIFGADGTWIAEWPQFGRPSGLAIDSSDVLYVIDSESSPERNPGWPKGLRVGSARTGEVWFYVPPHEASVPSGGGGTGAMGEGVAVDAAGNVYAGEVGSVVGLTRFVPLEGAPRPANPAGGGPRGVPGGGAGGP